MTNQRKIEDFVKFKTLEAIDIKKVEINDLNPRKRFGQEEEDELVESIKEKGVLNPIIVYERNGKYILLDGERRFRACMKLGLEFVPAHILERKPTILENLSIMFHIHNVHEDWTDLEIARTVQRIMDEIGIRSVENITREDIKEIKKITSLSEYKIKKFLDVLRYPKSVINKFMDSEKKEKPDLDIDTLAELRKPIKALQNNMDDVLKKYPVEKIVDIIIEKKKNKIIKTNKELRKLTTIVSNAKKNVINFNVAKEKILDFFDNKEKSIEDIYSEISEDIEQAKMVIKSADKLIDNIRNINLARLPKDEIAGLKWKLSKLKEEIDRKFEKY